MKKAIAIVVLGLLLSGNAYAGCTIDEHIAGECKKPWYKKLDVSSYFEKRKECKEFADMAKTVYMGKQRYKDCMEN